MTAPDAGAGSPVTLTGSDVALLDRYRSLLVDLDGVVQLGDRAVPAAPAALAAARERGLAVAFVTNNASRPVTEVAAALAALGVAAAPAEIVTSATATAAMLAAETDAGAAVLVVGGAGLRDALRDAGLRVVAGADDDPVAVVQGWAPDVGWPQLAEGAVALRRGARWVVTNRDATLPSPRGPLPGSGSLVAALVTATGREPDVVVGKPGPALFRAATQGRAGNALVVGDRLDTDIAGARAAGLPSLLVLSGVADPAGLLAATPAERPSYVGRDISAITRSHPPVAMEGDTAVCGGVRVSADGRVEGRPAADGDGLDGLRAACALSWAGRLEKVDETVTSLDLQLR